MAEGLLSAQTTPRPVAALMLVVGAARSSQDCAPAINPRKNLARWCGAGSRFQKREHRASYRHLGSKGRCQAAGPHRRPSPSRAGRWAG